MEDQKLAVVEGDANRVIADYAATLAIGRHSREAPFVVSQLMASHVVDMADERMLRLLNVKPTLLAGHEDDLAHQMAQANATFHLDFSQEKACALDVIQRVCSDDGHGGGHLTADGLRMLRMYEAVSSNPRGERLDGVWATLALPAAAALTADRTMLSAKIEQFFSAAQSEAATPFWLRRHQQGMQAADLLKPVHSSALAEIRFMCLIGLSPGLTPAIDYSEQRREFHQATLTVLAIQAFHHEQGHYPDTLAELTPHYLPSLPLDMRSGEPLTYHLEAGQPVLYGRGEDDQDHGGIWSDKPETWPTMPKHGDWVFYPPPPEQ